MSFSNKHYFVPPLPAINDKQSPPSSPKVTIIRNQSKHSRRSDDEPNDYGASANENTKKRSGPIRRRGMNKDEGISNDTPLSMNQSASNSSHLSALAINDEMSHHLEQETKPLVALEQGHPHPLLMQHPNSIWPKPFNDEFAIHAKRIPEIPSSSHPVEDIKNQIQETNNISIRIITWNQEAMSIPSPIDHDQVYNQLFLKSDGIISASANATNKCQQVQEQAEGEGESRLNNWRRRRLFYHHLIVIGTQECENSISKSILNPMKEKWEKSCIEALGDDYVFIQGHALQASHLAVFAHKSIVHLISDVTSHAVPTGICNTLGNKGGIGISLNVGKTSFCFLTAHLAAHQDQIDRRTFEFELISNEIARKLGQKLPVCDDVNDDEGVDIESEQLSPTVANTDSAHESFYDDENVGLNDHNVSIRSKGGTCRCCKSYCSMYCCCCTKHADHINPLLSEFDHVFWAGDLNYRINATRDVVDSLLQDNRHDILVANDQLKLLLQFEKTFSGFVEGPLTFRPTYKYDSGKDIYDTSSKRRIPSWTDRILYKDNPQVELVSYFCAQEVRLSDHRPVYASFKCNVNIDADEDIPRERNLLRSESKSEVCIIS